MPIKHCRREWAQCDNLSFLCACHVNRRCDQSQTNMGATIWLFDLGMVYYHLVAAGAYECNFADGMTVTVGLKALAVVK